MYLSTLSASVLIAILKSPEVIAGRDEASIFSVGGMQHTICHTSFEGLEALCAEVVEVSCGGRNKSFEIVGPYYARKAKLMKVGTIAVESGSDEINSTSVMTSGKIPRS